MKKASFFIASAVLLLAGCAKEQVGPGAIGAGDMVNINITAGTAEQSKAVIDGDGAAACVTRWIMEVRDAYGDVYAYKTETESAGTLQHTFNIKLVKNQQYTFAFWADNGGEYYDASDLCAVKYAEGKSVVAGVDAKDAFSAVETLTFTQSISKTITLYRPFAQLNVITNDLAALRADAISAAAYNAFKPKNFKTTITVPTQFNVLTGTASVETELILAADEFYGKTPVSYEDAPSKATMFMAYIFASKDEKDIRNVAFKFDVDSQTGNNAFNFTDVPLQRNYRTNILGNFLSGDAVWTVNIDPDWTGEYDYPPFEAGSIAEANASLAAGETNISVSNPEDYATVDLTIPAVADGKDIIIDIAENDEMELKIDASASTPKSIALSAVKAKSLDINAPASHVELTAGEYTDAVNAQTSATTLVVGKDTKIKTLNIKKGYAVIDGTVENFNNQTGDALVWNVTSTAELTNAVKFAGAGDLIKLAAIGAYAMPAEFKADNITVTGVGGAVLECPENPVMITSDNIVLKDLTIECNSQNTANSGALNISKSARLENVTFTEHSKKIVVVGGTGTVDFIGCRFENEGKGRGIMVWGGSPTINIDGCYFDNTYPFNVDGGSPVFAVKNSRLNGWTSYVKTATASFENCDFGKSTSGYAYCRPYSSAVFNGCNFSKDALVSFGADGITIDLNGCKLDGQPVTGKILDADGLEKFPNSILNIDGVAVYPFTSFDVSSVAELKLAVTMFNNSKQAVEHTIRLAAGTYEVADLVLWQNLTGKSLVVKAAEDAEVILKPISGETKSPYIFLVAGGSSYDATRAISFNGISFDYTQAEDVTSAPVYCCQQMDSYVSAIEGGVTNDTRYAHNITFNDCSLSVFSTKTENISFIAGPSAGSPKDVAFYNCTMTNGGYVHSGYINGIVCENCTVTGVKALINSQGEATDYVITVKNSTIDAWHDYVVRTSGGKIFVENNVFTAAYNGSDAGAAVVVVRKKAAEATFAGNTFNKASDSMWDCYCGGACIVNGQAEAAGTGINF